MRAVIAGAAGFVGCHLARRYLRDGWEVVGVDNLVTGQEDNVRWLSDSGGFTFVRHDVTEALKLSGPVHLVCDLACPASPVDFDRLGLEILSVCEYNPYVDGIFDILTPKQKEILLESYRSGFFDHPRKINAGELAEKMGMHKTTLLEHIHKAEKRLIGHILGQVA